MKRPSFQFYPGDWQANSNLRRCTHAEKGVWLDVMCLMHDQPEYGILRWPLKEIAQAVGAKPADLRGLVSKGVLKGSDTQLDEPNVYTPRSGRRDGEPVTLIPTQPGPIWYSSRMVKDEHVRTIRGESTRFGDESGEAPKHSPKTPFGDGSSSSSSSSTSVKKKEPKGSSSTAKLPTCPIDQIVAVYHEVLPELPGVRVMDKPREKAIRERWEWVLTSHKPDGSRRAETAEQGVEWFRTYFERTRDNDFLMGRTPRAGDHANWRPDIEFLLKSQGLKHVLEKTNPGDAP
ncbi:hypothetical protein [Hydrogenophaga sp.]